MFGKRQGKQASPFSRKPQADARGVADRERRRAKGKNKGSAWEERGQSSGGTSRGSRVDGGSFPLEEPLKLKRRAYRPVFARRRGGVSGVLPDPPGAAVF